MRFSSAHEVDLNFHLSDYKRHRKACLVCETFKQEFGAKEGRLGWLLEAVSGVIKEARARRIVNKVLKATLRGFLRNQNRFCRILFGSSTLFSFEEIT